MRWLLLLILLLVVACVPVSIEKQADAQVDQAIQRAIAYLQAEHRREPFNLLRESPVARPHKYWLATDNQLAVYALRAVHEDTLAAQLESARQQWQAEPQGLIEALAGEVITWPPFPERQSITGPTPQQRTNEQPNACSKPEDSPVNVICQEIRDEQQPAFADWQDYADLALYGALNACNQGNREQAHERFQQAMNLFDGLGFADKAYQNSKPSLYATYKLALALHVGALLSEQREDRLLTVLLTKQNTAGGFVTLYDSKDIGRGDSNTETTAYALLALATLQKRSLDQVRASVCPQN